MTTRRRRGGPSAGNRCGGPGRRSWPVARSSRDEPDRRFQSWDYETRIESMSAGVHRRKPDGHVTVHRGIRSRGETKRAKRKADGGLKRTGTS